MNDNNVVTLLGRHGPTGKPIVADVMSERVVDLARQAVLLPTTLSLSEIAILGSVILARDKQGRAAAKP